MSEMFIGDDKTGSLDQIQKAMSEITGIQDSLGPCSGNLEALRSDLEDIYCELSDAMLRIARNTHLFYLMLSGKNVRKELGAVLLFSSSKAAEDYRRSSDAPSAEIHELTRDDARRLFSTPDDMFLLNPAVDQSAYSGYDLLK